MCLLGVWWTKNVFVEVLLVFLDVLRFGVGEFYLSFFVEKNSEIEKLSYFGKLESFSNFWEVRWWEVDWGNYNFSESKILGSKDLI